ncbi:hypothetical protein Pla52o_10390 [Novipirellula galeiformis]|uniref:Methyltransferase FkbM domain-containing protein n=1 Tax=Novipirellula galeiformis TaxID=2528004 RepID=A0A5C6CTI1_9BACT|nr:FkbM family methyltransferase [Novipirellula galeiformis]TWU27175.1 hypothetical protein Pla52o_10390 [Novipirellula galeiformis]
MELLSNTKRLMERWFDCRIYRGWFPRGNNLRFDRTRIISEAPSIIFDVGANVGQTACSLAQQYPRAIIHAFEPVKSTFDTLTKNVRRFPNVRCHQLALGASTSVAKINIYQGSCNNSFVNFDNEEPLEVEEVSVQSLSQFCENHEIHKIDYLKIDTEGFDLEVVRGAEELFKRNAISTVLAELGFSLGNEKHVPFADFNEFMHSQGMGVFGIYDQRREFDGSHLLRRADCLFVSSSVCLKKLDSSPDV